MVLDSLGNLTDLDDRQWSVLREAVQGLEAQGRSGSEPDLAGFLSAPEAPLHRRMLMELIKVDQELRWAAGEHKPLEAYLREWPEIGQHAEMQRELLETECVTRTELGNAPTREELQRRFPNFADRVDLDAIVRSVNEEDLGLAGADTPPAMSDRPTDTNEFSVREPLPVEDLAVGGSFGRYEIRGVLGHGGMGTVYRAFDSQLRREVALKTPRFDPATESEIAQRFLREARAAAALHHPGVCPVFDTGEIDGRLYLTMALIEGPSLAESTRKGPLDAHRSAELTATLAETLEEVHAAGLLHRDIKPSNVMLDASGQPVLTDFGLARSTLVDSQITNSGSFLGTLAYAAPEQVAGRAADRRSDVYSLGVLLCQLLTGKLPFDGPMEQLVRDIARGRAARPRDLNPEIDANLERICAKAMASTPAARYQSAGEMAAALRRHLQGISEPHATRATIRRLLGLALLVLSVVGAFGALIHVRTSTGTLVLKVSHPDAAVSIDGRNVDITTPDSRISLRVGRHQLHVTKDGFETLTRSFRLRRGQEIILQARLLLSEVHPTGPVVFSDNFTDGKIDPKLWAFGGRNCSWTAESRGKWESSVEEKAAPDGYLELRVHGPPSPNTFGAAAWARTKYDFNDGHAYLINFTWSAELVDTHVNQFFVQMTDGRMPTFEQEHKFGSWVYKPPDDTSNMLWHKDTNGQLNPWRVLAEEDPPETWSVTIDPAGRACLYDHPNAGGQVQHKTQLQDDSPWHLQWIIYDATSLGCPAGTCQLRIHECAAWRLKGRGHTRSAPLEPPSAK